RVISWLLVLASEECDAALRANRELFARAWPNRAGSMDGLLGNPRSPWPAGRALALIDPTSRRRQWLIPARVDGRRSAASYRDYGDAAELVRGSPSAR
ncbi:MAG TPA: hypothetical protein VIH00_10430, partial [Candidatus Limnocylindrales bacterium]